MKATTLELGQKSVFIVVHVTRAIGTKRANCGIPYCYKIPKTWGNGGELYYSSF